MDTVDMDLDGGGDTDAKWRSALAALTVTPDGDTYILGRPDLGTYVAVPEPGAVLIQALRAGASLSDATRQASAAAGAEVDGRDFLTGLSQAGLLTTGTAAKTPGRRLRWVEDLPTGLVRPLFGRTAWVVYTAAAVAAVWLLVARPGLRPSFEDLWFLSDPMWSVLAGIPLSLALTSGHECWHWLAARALGVPSRIRVSRRGIFLVLESDLTQLVTVPRHRRYSPMLAGMAFDTSVLALSLGLRLGFREEALTFHPMLDRLLALVVIRQVIGLVWQLCAVAWRSDSYALLANALACQNLYRATWLTTKSRIWRLTARDGEELSGIGPHDRAVASWFAFVYLVGGVAMVALLVDYVFPVTLGMIRWVRPNLTEMGLETLAFWQSLVFMVLFTAQFCATPAIELWEHRLRKAGRLS